MRVLMFGWEFPPHIAGGLGTACEGIVKGLAHNGVETLFVMPSASGDEDQSATTIINASDVPVDTMAETVDEFLDKVKFIHIGSNMVPYADPEEFGKLVEEEKKRQVKDFSISYGQKFKFSGKYGANLMEEVARYAMVGGTIAMQRKDEFDVIHAHDWLTYYAGIAAKELTGKPLVIHVHATSFDRGSVDNIDTRVYAIEKRGMEMADRVVTVSDLTRNIVITRYGIDPAKASDDTANKEGLFKLLLHAPKTFWTVGLVQFFCWAAFMYMWTYSNGTIAANCWNATDTASEGYQAAGNWVGVVFAIQAVGSILWAIVIPKFKSLRLAYVVSLLLGAVGFISVAFVHNQYLLFLSYFLIGAAWAAMLALPFTLLTNSLHGEHMGSYLGLFNCTICLPQIVAAALGGVVLKLCGGVQGNMMIIAGVLLVLGAISVRLVEEKRVND